MKLVRELRRKYQSRLKKNQSRFHEKISQITIENINHDSWLVSRNDSTRFSTRQGLLFPLKCWNDGCFDFDSQCVWTLFQKKAWCNLQTNHFPQKYLQNLLLALMRGVTYTWDLPAFGP